MRAAVDDRHNQARAPFRIERLQAIAQVGVFPDACGRLRKRVRIVQSKELTVFGGNFAAPVSAAFEGGVADNRVDPGSRRSPGRIEASRDLQYLNKRVVNDVLDV